MGKKDSDRAEGQYKMQKNQEDPQLARQQAIEAARVAGIIGGPVSGGRGAHSVVRGATENAARQADVVGEVTDAKLADVPAVVIAAPAAKASALVKVVADTEAMIGVAHGGAIRPLNIQFHAREQVPSEIRQWFEVRVSTSGLTVEAVASKDTPLAWGELGKLKTALGETRDRRKFPAGAPVDVLVAPDVSAQQLVDVLVALEGAGVKMIGLGAMPGAEQLALRGKVPPPSVSIGNPNAQGDLDKSVIRAVVKDNIKHIRYCYEKELLAKPNIAGTVQTAFFITPSGKVANATASGVDVEVANCVAGAIKKMQFPKPKGGGGVQVNYPFTFRQQP